MEKTYHVTSYNEAERYAAAVTRVYFMNLYGFSEMRPIVPPKVGESF